MLAVFKSVEITTSRAPRGTVHPIAEGFRQLQVHGGFPADVYDSMSICNWLIDSELGVVELLCGHTTYLRGRRAEK